MDDLTGTADERMSRLSQIDGAEPAWLRRQLELALVAWGDDETRLDIADDSRIDF